MKSKWIWDAPKKVYIPYALREQRKGVWEIWAVNNDGTFSETGHVVARNNPRKRWELKTLTGNKVLLYGTGISDVIYQYPVFCGKSKLHTGFVKGKL